MYQQGYPGSRGYDEDIERPGYEGREDRGHKHDRHKSERKHSEYSRERPREQPRDYQMGHDGYRDFPMENDRSQEYQGGYGRSREQARNFERPRDFSRDHDRPRDFPKNRDRPRDFSRDHDRSRDRFRDRDRDGGRRRDDRYNDRRDSPSNDEARQKADYEAIKIRMANYRTVYKIDFSNRPTLFDIPPPGYEEMEVSEYKHLKAIGALPVQAIPQGSTIILRARRLYVENIPEGADTNDLLEAINKEMTVRNMLKKPGIAALWLDLGLDGVTAYLEFRTAEECNAAIGLDGMLYKGQPLKIGRPNDYQPHNGYYFGCPHVFQDTLNKLFVACVPIYLSDDQVRELLTAFGELKAFNLVKDGASGLSKGYAFCEYRDGTVTDIAISGLNGMQIGDKKLVVQRAVLGTRAGTNLGGIIPSQMQVPGVDPDHIISHDLLVTEVLCLINCLTLKDMIDDEEYYEIIEDVREECSKYGEVLSVEIPRPDPDNPDEKIENFGKIFVEFAEKDACKEAHENLAGRKFKDRLVITTFYDLDKYKRREF